MADQWKGHELGKVTLSTGLGPLDNGHIHDLATTLNILTLYSKKHIDEHDFWNVA